MASEGQKMYMLHDCQVNNFGKLTQSLECVMK